MNRFLSVPTSLVAAMLLLVALLSAACGSDATVTAGAGDPDPTTPPDEQQPDEQQPEPEYVLEDPNWKDDPFLVTLAGNAVEIGPGSRLALLEVDDQRCPVWDDVDCYWEGGFVATFRVTDDGQDTVLEVDGFEQDDGRINHSFTEETVAHFDADGVAHELRVLAVVETEPGQVEKLQVKLTPAPDARTEDGFGAPVSLAGEPFELGIGEVARIDDHLTIRLVEVFDGRCPQDVACVWEGEVGSVFSVLDDGVEQIIDLQGFDAGNGPRHSLEGRTSATFTVGQRQFELSALDLVLDDADVIVGVRLALVEG